MIENALAASGGEKYLREQARDNPTAFLALVSKLLPKDMNVKADVSMNVRKELIDRVLALMFGRPQPSIEQTATIQAIGDVKIEPQHNDY